MPTWRRSADSSSGTCIVVVHTVGYTLRHRRRHRPRTSRVPLKSSDEEFLAGRTSFHKDDDCRKEGKTKIIQHSNFWFVYTTLTHLHTLSSSSYTYSLRPREAPTSYTYSRRPEVLRKVQETQTRASTRSPNSLTKPGPPQDDHPKWSEMLVATYVGGLLNCSLMCRWLKYMDSSPYYRS